MQRAGAVVTHVYVLKSCIHARENDSSVHLLRLSVTVVFKYSGRTRLVIILPG